jgi:hypothetical protein
MEQIKIKTKLDILYQQYQATERGCQLATETQLNKLSELYTPLLTDDNPASSITDIYSKVLRRKLTGLDGLTHQDCGNLFKHYSNLNGINDHQRQYLLSVVAKYSWSGISALLGRSVTNMSTLTKSDFNKIVRKTPEFDLKTALEKFQNRPRDTIITSNTSWEYGWQYSTAGHDQRLRYIKFNDWLMLDYDTPDFDTIKNKLNPLLTSQPDLLFYVYRTRNGYHLLLMSELRDHFDFQTMRWMYQLGCDIWYILFTYRNGYRIRLSPKIHEPKEEEIYEYCGSLGGGTVHPSCHQYHSVYLDYLEVAQS